MMVSNLLSLFCDGYSYGMTMLIIGYFFLTKNRSKIKNFIAIANCWYAIFFIITLFVFIKEMIIAWYSQNPYEGYTFQYGLSLFSPYGFSLLGQYILVFVTAILFYFKKLRAKIWLSIIAIVSIRFSYIVIFFLSFYRDYLPSSFSYQRSNIFLDDILGILFFIFLVGTSYLVKNTFKS